MANLMEYKGYHGTVTFSSEDNLLIGNVIGVQDSLNFHGTSIEEVTQSFHDCVDGYLEMCKEFGKNPDKEYKGSFNVRIGPDLHRAADLAAKAAGITLNQLVQKALEEKVYQTNKSGSQCFIVIDTRQIQATISSNEKNASNYKNAVSLGSEEKRDMQWKTSTTLGS